MRRSQIRQKQFRKARHQRIFVFSVALLALCAIAVFAYATHSNSQNDPGKATGVANQLDNPATVETTDAVPASTSTVEAPQPAPAAAPAAEPMQVAGALAGKVICIDPGHASNPDMGTEPIGPAATEMKVKDPGGTSGVVSGVGERVVTLAIAMKLKTMLENKGARVVMTRTGDTFYGGNRERAQIANQAHADLFIRIHADGSTDSSRKGASTLCPTLIPGWTDDIYASSKKAAAAVQASLVANLGVVDGGVVERSDITGFNWADVPAILTEVGFMTNPQEDEKLNSADYQTQVANSLLIGIMNYFGG